MRQTAPENFIDLLEVFRLGLHTGILDRQIVVEWADQLVMQQEAPAYLLIELALGGRSNINDFIGLLDEHTGEYKPEVSKRVILGYLLHQFINSQITLEKAVRAIDWLAMHVDFSKEEHSFMAGIDDDYNLANEGICGTLFEIEAFLLRFLLIYQNFTLTNQQDWRELNDVALHDVQMLYQQSKTW